MSDVEGYYAAIEAAVKVQERITSTSPEEFAAQSAKDRDVTLFLLMRENAAQLSTLNFAVGDLVRRINAYEEMARTAMEPENLQALISKLTGGLLGGDMFKGMF